MKCIPILLSGSVMKNVLLLFCFSFAVSTVYSQYSSPITISNSTSQRVSSQGACPIVYRDYRLDDGVRKLYLEIKNNWRIDILDFDVVLENAVPNTVTGFEIFSSNNYNSGGLPILSPGSNFILVEFAKPIQTIGTDLVKVKVSIENAYAPRFAVPRDFMGSACIELLNMNGRAGTIRDESVSNEETQNLSYDIVKDKSSEISGLILSDVMPRLRLDVENEKEPIMIFLTNILNPTVNQVVMQNRYLAKGVHDMPLSEAQLPSGIYQLIIQQGENIQKIKYYHSH